MGKRSGEGFIAHKATLVNALSRAIADRVIVNNITLGRKGLLTYLKALGGSNIVKVTPNGSASEAQAAAKQLKVICGANTSYLPDNQWIDDNTPMSFCEVRVSPNNTVKPNVGSIELAEALSRVLPFASKEDNRPALQCILFKAKDGKLTLVSADGFRLAMVSLDYDEMEGQAIIPSEDLKGIATALKKARRTNISFKEGNVNNPPSLIIDTELTRYHFVSFGDNYPEYEKLIPKDFNTFIHLDTLETIQAVSSLQALSDDTDNYPIDLTFTQNRITMTNPDGKGQADTTADVKGEGFARVNGRYLSEVLRAFNGMVDLSLSNAYSPMLFSSNGYKVVVMPMITDKANEQAKADNQAKEAVKPEAKATKEAEPAKPKTEVKPKDKKTSKAKEPVTAK